MHELHIDLETYSSVDIKKSGAWKYIDSPDFEILLFAYCVDDQPVQCIDFASGEKLPDWLHEALTSSEYVKKAYNAHFEFGCLSKVFGPMVPSQWRCVMFHGLYAGFTAGLDLTGRVLGLSEDKQKNSIGKQLIKYFCVPCKATKTNLGRTRNLPHHDPDKWELFKGYNIQDVVAEREIEHKLEAFPVPDWVQRQWETDLIINQRGVAVDMDLAEGALAVGAEVRQQLTQEAMSISGLNNPNSVKQLAAWLSEETDDDVTDLRKDTVARMLQNEGNSASVQRMLEIRQELGKTSTKKYDAVEACTCSDGRVRGLLQYYGANRTGRWAGRLVQVQNLPRTYTKAIDVARELVKDRKTTALKILYGSVSSTLSQLIRTTFIPKPGNVFIDADFSAIEARVISWIAGEEWRLEVFRTHGKIYEASASQMFGVPIDRIVKGNPEYALRAKGKVAELALGYQGGPGALINMGALDMGLTEDELPEIVTRWRNSNSRIKNFWNTMNNWAINIIQIGGSKFIPIGCGDTSLILRMEQDVNTGMDMFTIELPSGRKLYYVNPALGTNRFEGTSITYYGLNQTTKKWQKQETYGGKLTENVVQAIARDALAGAIERLESAGLPVVFHIHDEVVIDAVPFDTDPKAMLKKVTSIMTEPIPWAPSLPLGADGWVGNFFTKD